MELQMPNMLAAFNGGVDRGKGQRYATLASQAMVPGANRQQIVSEMAGIDPKAAQQFGGSLEDQDERALRKAAGAARYIVDAAKSGNVAAAQAAYRYALPALQPWAERAGKTPPPDFSEDMVPGLEAIAGVFGGGTQPVDTTPAAIRELQMLRDNPDLLAIDTQRRQAGWQPQWKTDDQGNAYWATPGQAPRPAFDGDEPPTQPPVSAGGSQVLDDAFFDAQQAAESANDPNAVSPAGARGLMQIMPATARDPGYGMPPIDLDRATPEENAAWGREYMRRVTAAAGGDPRMGLAAYNWGIGNVQRAMQQPGATPERVLAQAPRETQQYVQRVMGGAQQRGSQVPTFGRKESTRSAPSGYEWAPDGRSLVPIAGGPADRKANPTPADQAKDERAMRKELADVLKEPKQIVDAYRRVESAASNPNAASDLSLIFGYMKMLDPGSVVREGEFANAQNAASVPDQVRNAWNKVLSGERLNPKQRAQFVGEARKLRDIAASTIATKEMEYGQMAEEYGYDPRRATGAVLATPQGRKGYQDAMRTLQEARDAIRAGADRNAVRQRLIKLGFKNIAGRI